MAVSGDDFCIVAADTRQSNGYSINTRYAPKAYKLYTFEYLSPFFSLIFV